MARRNPFRRIRLVYQRSSNLVKCIVLATIVLSTVALLALHIAIKDANAREEELRKQAAALEQENNALVEKTEKADTIEGMKEIAEEELGLVDPDTVIFIPEQ